MAAIAFAEEGEGDTAQEITDEWMRKMQEDTKKKTEALIIRYRVNVGFLDIAHDTASGDVVSSIKKVVEREPAINMVLLSPSLGGKGGFDAKKLLKSISKPIVSVSRLSNANI